MYTFFRGGSVRLSGRQENNQTLYFLVIHRLFSGRHGNLATHYSGESHRICVLFGIVKENPRTNNQVHYPLV